MPKDRCSAFAPIALALTLTLAVWCVPSAAPAADEKKAGNTARGGAGRGQPGPR